MLILGVIVSYIISADVYMLKNLLFIKFNIIFKKTLPPKNVPSVSALLMTPIRQKQAVSLSQMFRVWAKCQCSPVIPR